VVHQQDPNGFSSYPRRQPSLDGLLGDQAHRPTGESGGRVATNQGDDALFLLVVQDRCGTGALLLVKSSFQPVLLVAADQIADGLRAQAGRLGALRSARAIGEVKEGEGAEDDADLLDGAFEQLASSDRWGLESCRRRAGRAISECGLRQNRMEMLYCKISRRSKN